MKNQTDKQLLFKCILYLIISFVAIYIRYLGRNFLTSDFTNCLNVWFQDIKNAGPGIDSLLAYNGDYAMPYATVIWLMGKLPVPFLYSLKTLNGIFDFILAILVGKLVQHFKPENPNSFLFGYSVILLLPNVFLNSCYWGQCDAMYTTFILATILCLLNRKYPAMMFFLGLAFSFKLQAIFVLPFIMITYWLKKEFSALQFLIVPFTMLIMNIPAIIASYSPAITFTKYMGQTGNYPYLYYFYPNPWFFFQARPYYLFNTGAIMLTATALLIFVVLLVRKNVQLNRENMLPILLWTMYTCVFFLPSMHERYGFSAEIVAVVIALIHLRRAWLAVGMLLCTFHKYLYAIDLMNNPMGLQMAESIVNTILYLLFTCVLWHQLFQQEGGSLNA